MIVTSLTAYVVSVCVLKEHSRQAVQERGKRQGNVSRQRGGPAGNTLPGEVARVTTAVGQDYFGLRCRQS